jgi:quercetin dioxygenase-like cupin family protein
MASNGIASDASAARPEAAPQASPQRTRLRRLELSGERPLTAPGSVNAAVRRLAAEAHVAVIDVEPGGIVGRHSAGGMQLFAVIRGSGWVSGGEGERDPIRAGEAVVWDLGEEHESGSEEGMTVFVVEARSLDV